MFVAGPRRILPAPAEPNVCSTPMNDSTDNHIRIVIADDHALLRQGLKQTMESSGAAEVVGQAGNGRAAVSQVEALKPDVVILDVDMPELDGFGAARAIRKAVPAAQIIFLTVHCEP